MAMQLGITMTNLQTVLRESDVISIHVPGSKDNIGLIGSEEFKAMKNGAVAINTSRGIVVDSAALLNAIKNGHIAGAGIDVYTQEPPNPDEPVLQDSRILCAPHTASETIETFSKNSELIVRQIIDAFEGRTPGNWVNP